MREELREKIADIVSEYMFGVDIRAKRQFEAADRILALVSPTPLADRVLIALGGMRDGMTPEEVTAVQRFASALKDSQ